MKKILGCIAILSIATSCDDGDLVFDQLNFTQAEIKSCNSLFFKTNGTELLLVNLSDGTDGIVLDTEAPINQVQSLSTNNTNQIYYRTYSDNISEGIICSTIPPAHPIVTTEYISNSGALIQYVRGNNVGFTNNRATINYNFTITFSNLTLSNGTSEIKYETYPFGTLVYNTQILGFTFSNFSNCTNQLISSDSDEELIFTTDTNFELPTTVGEHTYQLSQTQNLAYKLYDGNIVNQAPCDEKTNVIKEDWISTQGNYVILTTEVVNQVTQNVVALKHEFYLRNVTFTKNGLTFTVENLKIQEQTQQL